MKKGINLKDKNGQWKGDRVGYEALHDYIKYHLPKSEFCQNCRQIKSLDLANISQEYKRDLLDWEWLCRSCHMKKDGRLEALLKAGSSVKSWSKTSKRYKGELNPNWKGGISLNHAAYMRSYRKRHTKFMALST